MSSTTVVSPAIRVSTRQYRFNVVREEAPEYPIGAGVVGALSAAEIARAVIGTEITEVLIAIFLDARHRVMGYTEIARGTINANRFSPRDVLAPVLLASAPSFAIAHCHPSGQVTPSRADRIVTAKMREAAALIGVDFIDHLIVSEHSHYSFREHGDLWDNAGATSTDGVRESEPRFPLGRIVATPGAIETMTRYGINPAALLSRHQHGDWGDVPAEDAAENELAVGRGCRILSSYGAEEDDRRLWVITEADRSVTTILRPDEY